MTTPPNPHPTEHRSAAARRLVAKEAEIFDAWERRARQAVAAARGTSRLVLRDYLVAFLHHLIEALERFERGLPQTDAREFLDAAGVHGRLRAAIPAYDIGQVIREYALMRQCVLEALQPELSTEQRELVTLVVEEQMTAAATAFNKVVQEVQRHTVRALSHDMRSPLAALQLSLEMALRKRNDPEQVQRQLQRGLSLLRRLDRLTEDVLDSAALERGLGLSMEFAEAELCTELIQPVFESARLTYGERVVLQTPTEPVRGRFSKGGCERALENLIDNAVKYGDREGPITLALSADEAQVRLAVHNQGEPIPEEERARIFSAFVRREHAGTGPRGWGLGLSLVAAVARAHGGEVELASEPGQGTRFTLVLPRSGPAADEVLALPSDK